MPRRRVPPLLIAVALQASAAVAEEALRVIDGDTIERGGIHYRIEGLDAPEERGRASCLAERRLAVLATARAEALFSAAARLEIEAHGLDRYGRTLARVRLDGRDFAETMIAEGYAQPWEGRRRWCRS